jgi:glycosyltransferase involved in cell wall biosynthesis
VETGDGVALAGAIARLIRDPALGARLGAAGREHVRRQFTWDVTASRFETLYSRTLAAA